MKSYPKIQQIILSEITKQKTETMHQINAETEKSELFYCTGKSQNLITKKQFEKSDINQAKAIIFKNLTKNLEKKIIETNLYLYKIANSEHVDNFTVTVEWKKSAMWGMNPNVELKYFADTAQSFTAKASGCGYCKESSAISDTFNQSNHILKLFCDKLESVVNLKHQNREQLHKLIQATFVYGISFYNKLSFSQGTGVECYYKNFKSIGYTFKKVSFGKTFGVYTITQGVNND